MSWQDAVIALGQAVYALALVPALRAVENPPIVTCHFTGTVLCAYAIAFASLALWFSAGMSLVCGTLWIWLGLQERT